MRAVPDAQTEMAAGVAGRPRAFASAPPNLRSLEALRGVLAVYVLLGHVRWLLWDGHFRWIQEPHPWWANALAYSSAMFRYGHEAVMCFFVLSGFFIHFRWAEGSAEARLSGFSLRGYVKRRAHRLLPPYLLALLATLVLDLVGWTFFPSLYLAASGDAMLDEAFGRAGLSAQSVVPALLMLPGSLGTSFGTNGPLWSLAYEFVYYALYPVWLAARVRFGASAYIAACLATVAASVVIPDPFASNVLLLYPMWLAGAAMAEYALGPRAHGFNMPVAGLFALAGFAIFHFVKGPSVLAPYLLLGVGVVGFAAAIPAAAADAPVHRALEWLGVRSYTIYISHFPFIALVSAAIFETMGRRPSSGWAALAAVAAALAWCNVIWWLGERRFLHARFRVATRTQQ